MIVMRVRDFGTPLWERLRSLLFRPKGLDLIVNDAVAFRLVPSTAAGPMIMRIPVGLDYRSYPLSINATKLAFSEPSGGSGPGDKVTVDFYELPIASAQ
jgi:hypothetical protein